MIDTYFSKLVNFEMCLDEMATGKMSVVEMVLEKM